ncbi:ThuA domain-containing protein [Mariniflexile fucanivorans]|uniref:ThuA domain-containing protein n=1 Tax=Mariniflexile fucanivorans TaxID=264023 RepID=UPI0014043F3B|nr:ThuA domain-containing protein [Mariniflexile fucanivorans]
MLNKITLVFFLTLFSCLLSGQEVQNVLLLSGKKTHGYGYHECNSDITILAELLKKQTEINFNPLVFLNGDWPDATQLKSANAIVIICDGDEKHILNNKVEEFNSLQKTKIGVLFLHYATVPEEKLYPYFEKWLGGFYNRFKEPKTITKFTHVKIIPNKKHAINNGVSSYKLFDEIYYEMDLDSTSKVIGKAIQINKTPLFNNEQEETRYFKDKAYLFKSNPKVVYWSYKRESGGLSVGITAGHIHWNFWNEKNIRKQLLNSVAWIATGKVPKKGLNPFEVTNALLLNNHSKLEDY